MRSVRPTLPLLLFLVASGTANAEPPGCPSGTDAFTTLCQPDNVEQQLIYNARPANSLSGGPDQEDNPRNCVTCTQEGSTCDAAELSKETS